jgi:hypothetical protein
MEFDHIDLVHMHLCFRGGEKGRSKAKREWDLGIEHYIL